MTASILDAYEIAQNPKKAFDFIDFFRTASNILFVFTSYKNFQPLDKQIIKW